MTSDEKLAVVVEQARQLLGEHFDCVQILVSWQDGEVTKHLSRGCGNWFARQGQMQDFINRDLADEQATAIADKIKPEDDDD